jgi:tellurite resistance-related uncharacterized protein
MAIPGDEQETIISYDKATDQWHYYSDVPKHNRKWDALVKSARRELDEYGQIAVLEGEVIGNVTLSKKRKFTEEQKQVMAQRAKAVLHPRSH